MGPQVGGRVLCRGLNLGDGDLGYPELVAKGRESGCLRDEECVVVVGSGGQRV